MIPVHVFTLDGLLVWGYYPDEFGLLTHEIMRLVEAEIIGGSSSNVLTWIRRSNVVREQKVVAGRMKDILNSPHNFENGWFKFWTGSMLVFLMICQRDTMDGNLQSLHQLNGPKQMSRSALGHFCRSLLL